MDPVPAVRTTDSSVARAAATETPLRVAPATPVYLARHGQTQSNLQRRYGGYSPEPLTEAGLAQMSALAARLSSCGIVAVRTSEVARARQSGEVVSRVLRVPLRTDPRLNEMRLGPWEGLTETEVASRFPNEHALWCTLPDRLVLEGRETLAMVAARVREAIQDAASEPAPVLLVSHVAPMRVAVLSTLGLPLSLYKHVTVRNGDTVLLRRDRSEASRLGEQGSLREDISSRAAGSSLA